MRTRLTEAFSLTAPVILVPMAGAAGGALALAAPRAAPDVLPKE